jgi:hypothetical protein
MALDLTGQTFGRLTVVRRAPSIKETTGRVRTRWLCQCDCGNSKIALTGDLKRGHTKSCGCWHAQRPLFLRKVRKAPWAIDQDFDSLGEH